MDSIERNLSQFYSFWADKNGINKNATTQFTSIYTQGKSWPSFILDVNLNKGNASEFLDEIVAGIKLKIVPPFLICFEKRLGNSFLQQLDVKGFRPVTLWSGMKLEQYSCINSDVDSEFSISQVNGKSNSIAFTDLVNTDILRMPALIPESLNNTNPGILKAFLGSYHKESCSTAAVFVAEQTAGIYFVGTKSEFRRKGFARAMTIHAINESIKSGLNTFVLHASKAGKSLYLDLGFREHDRIVVYWLPQ
jgi:hypothetical protein